MMQRWYPFHDLRQMQNTVDRMWRRADSRSNGSEESPDTATWAVPLDVLRKGDDTIVRASLPGVSPEDIRVSIEDNVLTIKAHTSQEFQDTDGDYLMRERRSGSFHRALRLPDSVDPEKVQPHFQHGVLSITVPKAEAKRARQLEVKVGAPEPPEGS